MIDLYMWTTDNGYKARIAMEECGLDHKVHAVELSKKQQMTPEFIKISPGHKIPAIIDNDGPGGASVSLCESGAILNMRGRSRASIIRPIRWRASLSTNGCSMPRRPSRPIPRR